MEGASITFGVDLAAQPKVTAACAVAWLEGQARIERLECPLDDEAILRMIADYAPTKVAIDAPFGWPDAFVAAVVAWHADDRWPVADTPELRLRLTDRVVIREAQQQPLSVSSDRIAVTA
jgi:predicted nuclease with RNAse H fold